jgi:hypothetical protein
MKKPGRPRLDPEDQTVPVSTKMPSRQYGESIGRYVLSVQCNGSTAEP